MSVTEIVAGVAGFGGGFLAGFVAQPLIAGLKLPAEAQAIFDNLTLVNIHSTHPEAIGYVLTNYRVYSKTEKTIGDREYAYCIGFDDLPPEISDMDCFDVLLKLVKKTTGKWGFEIIQLGGDIIEVSYAGVVKGTVASGLWLAFEV